MRQFRRIQVTHSAVTPSVLDWISAPDELTATLGELTPWDSDYLRAGLVYLRAVARTCLEYCASRTPDTRIAVEQIGPDFAVVIYESGGKEADRILLSTDKRQITLSRKQRTHRRNVRADAAMLAHRLRAKPDAWNLSRAVNDMLRPRVNPEDTVEGFIDDPLLEWFTRQRRLDPSYRAPSGYRWKVNRYERKTGQVSLRIRRVFERLDKELGTIPASRLRRCDSTRCEVPGGRFFLVETSEHVCGCCKRIPRQLRSRDRLGKTKAMRTTLSGHRVIDPAALLRRSLKNREPAPLRRLRGTIQRYKRGGCLSFAVAQSLKALEKAGIPVPTDLRRDIDWFRRRQEDGE
jgi:hypothetical protein